MKIPKTKVSKMKAIRISKYDYWGQNRPKEFWEKLINQLLIPLKKKSWKRQI